MFLFISFFFFYWFWPIKKGILNFFSNFFQANQKSPGMKFKESKLIHSTIFGYEDIQNKIDLLRIVFIFIFQNKLKFPLTKLPPPSDVGK